MISSCRCQGVLIAGHIDKARDAGALSSPLSAEMAAQVMNLLGKATSISQPNLQEVCLNLLHKLVRSLLCYLPTKCAKCHHQKRVHSYRTMPRKSPFLQVAYAWLHGETTSNGAVAEDNLVTQAIHAVAVCADSMSSQVHLGVIQALLTIAMSEFFIVHGEALVQCLRIIFNLAIATDDKMISLTAHNALLQVWSPSSP